MIKYEKYNDCNDIFSGIGYFKDTLALHGEEGPTQIHFICTTRAIQERTGMPATTANNHSTRNRKDNRVVKQFLS